MDDVVKTDEDHVWGRAGEKAMSFVIGNHKRQYGRSLSELAPEYLYICIVNAVPLLSNLGKTCVPDRHTHILLGSKVHFSSIPELKLADL